MDHRARWGQLSPTRSINEAIYACFDDLPDREVEKLARKLSKLVSELPQGETPHLTTGRSCLDLYHEILIGAHLARNGSVVEYDRPFEIEGRPDQTPDWAIMDAQRPACIVEVVTHHEAAANAGEIASARAEKRLALYYSDNAKRLFDRIDLKTGIYAELAKVLKVPFVVGVFGSFLAGIYPDEVEEIVKKEMLHRPELSGVLFAEDDGAGGHQFSYFPAPNAEAPITLPSGNWTRRAA